MARSAAYYAVIIGVLLWCTALLVLPLAASARISTAGIGYGFFSHICHQEDSRSLHIAGYPLAVCARCSAIYFGFFFGVLLYPFLSGKVSFPPRWMWIIAVAPMMFDVGADVIGLHVSSIPTRLASGSVFGVSAALILTPLLVGACSELINRHLHQSGIHHERET